MFASLDNLHKVNRNNLMKDLVDVGTNMFDARNTLEFSFELYVLGRLTVDLHR